jgi:hypothetical protein
MRKGFKGLDPSLDADLLPESALYLQHLAQRERGQMRLKISADEVDAMVRQFKDTHGGATVCPPAYACRSRQYHVR